MNRIRLIEETPLLSLISKIDVLLVYAGEKPSTFCPRQAHLHDPESGGVSVDEAYVQAVREFFDWLDVPYRLSVAGEPPFMMAYVAHSEDNLEKLLNAMENDNERGLGRCFGYPETAIQAYLGELPSFEGDKECYGLLRFFMMFRMSEEFLDDEISSTSKRWHDTVKRLSPRLYAEIEEFCEEGR